LDTDERRFSGWKKRKGRYDCGFLFLFDNRQHSLPLMPTSDPSPPQLILGSPIMVVGSLLQASVGFGIALFVVPLLVLLNPVFVPGPMPGFAFVLCP
jgi:hypothetical protein